MLIECEWCCAAVGGAFDTTPPTLEEIIEVAQATIQVLNIKLDINSCLFGSLACYLYGMRYRDPKDVDLILLNPDLDLEVVKEELVKDDSGRFMSFPCIDPTKTHRVLYAHLPTLSSGKVRRCKIDLLKPGEICIPRIPLDIVQIRLHLPVPPLILLILLKLNGWNERRKETKSYLLDKVPIDEKDVNQLLDLAIRPYKAHISKEKHLLEDTLHLGRKNIRRFIKVHPESAKKWKAIGFDDAAETELSQEKSCITEWKGPYYSTFEDRERPGYFIAHG